MEKFMAMYNKVMSDIDYMAGMIEDDENLHEYLVEAWGQQGCWEETYNYVFNILDIMAKELED